MRNFQFNENQALEDQRIESIIQQRKRKLKRQQTLFVLFLTFILMAFGYYLYTKIAYTDFDGYIQTHYKHYRAKGDLYLYKLYKRVGDIVVPGDTLYSYMFLDNILNSNSLRNEATVVTNDRSMRLQAGVAAQDLSVLRVKINELKKQIKLEDHNIQFGLTDNSHKMDLQRQLAEAEAQLNALLQKLEVYDMIGTEAADALKRSAADERYRREDIRLAIKKERESVHYAMATDTGVVTRVFFEGEEPVFKAESIVQTQSANLQTNRMNIIAYVSTDDMGKLNNHTRAEVIVNKDIRFPAHVKMLGARTEALPTELRNTLSRVYTAVVVIFEPDAKQNIPFWAVIDKIPVVIRVRNSDSWNKEHENDIWYIGNGGLTEKSRKDIEMMYKKELNERKEY